MRPFLAQFSEPVWSGHLPSWADFITEPQDLGFRYAQRPLVGCTLFDHVYQKWIHARVSLIVPGGMWLRSRVPRRVAPIKQERQSLFLADDFLDLDAAQGLDAVSYQMQELLPLYAFRLTTFHIYENESRHLVGNFKLRFARHRNINFFRHLATR
ncbi:hypothetical protein Q2941_48825, partial [Bradyrhizobium sp. UFLA05-153]